MKMFYSWQHSLVSVAKNLVKRLPLVNKVLEFRNRLQFKKEIIREVMDFNWFVPPGHYYSPLPSRKFVEEREDILFDRQRRTLPAIKLNESGQIEMFHKLSKFYSDLPYEIPVGALSGLRYSFENDAYSYSDAITLFAMIRFLKPKRIIEIGSGYSSCVILDTNELFFSNSINPTFIEPYPQLLQSLLKPEDKIDLLNVPLQDVNIDFFRNLQQNDILFIDSTHVSKIGSDVNYIFFEILPAVNKGVYIHFHDIFHPFEYPKQWIYEGRAWNEGYLLRAFLEYNTSYEIVFFGAFMHLFHNELFRKYMPLCLKNTGASIWLKKLVDV